MSNLRILLEERRGEVAVAEAEQYGAPPPTATSGSSYVIRRPLRSGL
jgi:hypothetical protein